MTHQLKATYFRKMLSQSRFKTINAVNFALFIATGRHSFNSSGTTP
jgi:hypothetical protein